MRIISAIIIPLIFTGCASTNVVNHDFKTVSGFYQNQFSLNLNDKEKSQVFPKEDQPSDFFINLITGGLYSYSAQVKTYKTVKKLKLNITSDFWDGILISSGTVITICSKNEEQTLVKVKSTDSLLFIPFSRNDIEEAYLNSLTKELDKNRITAG